MKYTNRHRIAARVLRATIIEQLMRDLSRSSRGQIRNHLSLRALVTLLKLSVDAPMREQAGRAVDPLISGALRFLTPSKIQSVLRGLGAPQRMIDEVVAKRQLLNKTGRWPTWQEQKKVSTEGMEPAPDGPAELDWWDQLENRRLRVRELRLNRQKRNNI